MEKATKAFEVNNNYARTSNVNVGDVHVHLDGSGVTDPDSFCETFSRSHKMQRAIQAATIDQIGKPYCNSHII